MSFKTRIKHGVQSRKCTVGAHVCTCSVCTCVFAQSLHVLAKPWGGIIANFSPRTQSPPPPPFTDLHPSLASAAGHVVMRWELTFIIPGGGNTATNRDLPRRLLMMSVQRSRVWVHPFRHPPPLWFICTCPGVFNCGGTFYKVSSFSL